MSKPKTEVVFHSVTKDMYATIPAWAVWSKTLKTAKCYHFNGRKSITVDLDDLRDLVRNHKVWLSMNEETGSRYITSKEWRKYFG